MASRGGADEPDSTETRSSASAETPSSPEATPSTAPSPSTGSSSSTGPSSSAGAAAPPASQPRPRRGRALRIVLLCGLAVALLGAGIAVSSGLYLKSVDSKVRRVDAFTEVPDDLRPKPPAAARGAENLLILGSDSRDPDSTAGSRSDTIILVHLPKDRKSAQLVSIPRDTWLHIPRAKNGRGGTTAKINAAMAWGGVPLVVQTVEEFTGVRIDHVALVDFSGFKEIIDTLGGVDIDVDQSFTSTHALSPGGRRHFKKGMQHMDGAMALDYSHERYAFPDGDFTRIKHQQQMIKAVLDKAASAGILTNPVRLNALITATANAVSVDESLSLFDLATQLKDLRSGNLTFITSPSRGTGRVGDQSVVFADTAKAKALYDAIRRDSVPEILAAAA